MFITLESKLLVNSGVDNDLFADAYALAINRNDGKICLAYSLMRVCGSNGNHVLGKPLPPQNMVSLKQAAGVVLFTALDPSLTEAAPAFIVENKVYTETKDYALSKEMAEGLWKLSEELVGEKFAF
ncbi:short-chain dehydrogenase protein [Rutstroemia sp. NJR-2017a BBW]|nr:short-chain dehydrogenase protein [Rutstroemia sp. NJR-2017a BBW]